MPGDIYLLFSGTMPDGTRTNEIVAEIVSQATVNVHDIGDTDAGKLFSDSRFTTALNKAVAKEYFLIDDIADATPSQIKEIELKTKELMSGIDEHHNRISNSSLWDFVSHSYVEAADGSFRIIAPNKLDDLSVFVQSELPALLENPKITSIDGIQRIDLLALKNSHGLDTVKKLITANSLEQVFFTGLSTSQVGWASPTNHLVFASKRWAMPTLPDLLLNRVSTRLFCLMS